MLVTVLMICLTMTMIVVASNELPNLQKVPAGYFLSENVAQKIIEEYPELGQILENAMKVESGSYMNDTVTIELGNKIEQIKTSEQKYKEKYEVTFEVLQEERNLVDEMKQADEKVIKILDEQIESWKERYRKTQLYNTVEKAGLAVIIMLMASD